LSGPNSKGGLIDKLNLIGLKRTVWYLKKRMGGLGNAMATF